MNIFNRFNKALTYIKNIDDVMQSITDALLLKKSNLEELAESYSHATDTSVLETQKNERLTFIAGNLSIKIIEEVTGNIEVLAELFFQDAENEWIKKELKSKIRLTCLTDEALEKLKHEKIVKYKITPPQEKN